MKVFYSRVSSNDQNDDRQLQDLNGFDYVITDKCSGLIPLFERPQGKVLKDHIEFGQLKHLEVHSIDRLGRNTIDVLQVWKELTEMGITVVCRNPNVRNFTEEGKPDMFSELLISILGTMATFTKNMIAESQKEGIAIAKARGKYTGRRINTKDSPEKFLAKPKVKKILEYLDSGYTFGEITKILKCSAATVMKAKNFRLEVNEH
jgi:DNA invertase Pin-like site-specific DNA recombinase